MDDPNLSSQSTGDPAPVCHIVTPIGMLGYGFNEPQTKYALGRFTATNVPTALILDSGSTDSGPDKLALGEMTCPRSSYVRDLTKLLRLVDEFKVPLIFSSAGGDGSDDHVREMVKIIEEICDKAENQHYRLKTIAIFSEIKKTLVHDRLRKRVITGCGKVVPPLKEEDISGVPRIVSQMGPEPFMDAMYANPDFNIIVGGRAYDPSPYVAYAAFIAKAKHQKVPSDESQRLWGGFTHMGKIMECGGACAKPKTSGASATVYADGTFDIVPNDPEARCTSISVAAHGLYEKSRPDILSGPGGFLDLTKTQFEELEDGRTLRVRGGLFTFTRDTSAKYQIKLEAATAIGYRSMYIGSFKDPILIGQLDDLLARIKEYVVKQHEDIEEHWELDFHTYGRNQVSAEPDHIGEPSEVFLVGEALAESQDLATSVASTARIATIHGSYPNQKATSGNMAFGIGGKTVIPLGVCSRFAIYHLMEIEDGEDGLRSDDYPEGLFGSSVHISGFGKKRSIEPEDAETRSTKRIRAEGKTKEKPTENALYPAQQSINSPPKTLGDLASVLRSKNSGPYELTFDVLFDSKETYEAIKRCNLLTPSRVAEVLEVEQAQIIWSGFFDQALAYKITIPRLRKGAVEPNGGYMESDVHGSQKYLPLGNMKLPEGFA